MINNVLNEVCNGLSIPDFEAKIGESLEFVEQLLSERSKVV